MPLTDEGNEFWIQPRRGYKEQWAKNANQITCHIACDWDAAGDVKQYLLGWTEWDGLSTTFTRHLAYKSPFGTELYADSCVLVDFGLRLNLPDSDPDYDNWPKGDWCVYEVVFVRPPYKVLSDEVLELDWGGLESERYVSVRRSFNGRERRRPSYVFETDEASPIVVDEVGFVPDWSQVLMVTFHEIPESAFPERAVANCLAKVNDATVTIRGRDYPAETLLFKGVAQELEPYPMPDGELALDPIYRIEYRPDTDAAGNATYGWNGYRKNDGTYVRLRVKSAPSQRPYQTTDFGKLFIPSDVA